MPAPKKHPRWGGRQKGSKNKTTVEKEMALKVLQDKILEKWEVLINKKLELAEGVFVMKPINKNGQPVEGNIYKEKPDKESLEYLFSMVVGKPTQAVDINATKPIYLYLPEVLLKKNGLIPPNDTK